MPCIYSPADHSAAFPFVLNSRQRENDARRPEQRNGKRDGDRSDQAKADKDQPGSALLNHLTTAGRAGDFFGHNFSAWQDRGERHLSASAQQSSLDIFATAWDCRNHSLRNQSASETALGNEQP